VKEYQEKAEKLKDKGGNPLSFCYNMEGKMYDMLLDTSDTHI